MCDSLAYICYFDCCETLLYESLDSLISRIVKWNVMIFEPFVLKCLDLVLCFLEKEGVLILLKSKQVQIKVGDFLHFAVTLWTSELHLSSVKRRNYWLHVGAIFSLSKICTLTEIVLSGAMWHLVALYRCSHMANRYFDGSPQPSFHVLRFVCIFLLIVCTWTKSSSENVKLRRGRIKVKAGTCCFNKIFFCKCSQVRTKYYSVRSWFLLIGLQWAYLKNRCLISPELAAFIRDPSVTCAACSQSKEHQATSL